MTTSAWTAVDALEHELENVIFGELPPVGPSCPGASQETIADFGQYDFDPEKLPPMEQGKIRTLADTIARSFSVGCLPILGVFSIGHADRDFQRGARFEQSISEDRARTLQAKLKTAVADAFSRMPPPATAPSVAMVDWTNRGVGATEPVVGPNAPLAQRGKNRRVVVYLVPGTVAVPAPLPPFDWRDAVRRGQALLAAVSTPTLRTKRLQCVLTSILTPTNNDRYVTYDWLVRQQVAMPPPALVPRFLQSVRRDLGQRGVFGPAISNADFLSRLENIDVNILHGINKLDEHAAIFGIAADRFKVFLKDWVATAQQDPRSIYYCYGAGQP